MQRKPKPSKQTFEEIIPKNVSAIFGSHVNYFIMLVGLYEKTFTILHNVCVAKVGRGGIIYFFFPDVPSIIGCKKVSVIYSKENLCNIQKSDFEAHINNSLTEQDSMELCIVAGYKTKGLGTLSLTFSVSKTVLDSILMSSYTEAVLNGLINKEIHMAISAAKNLVEYKQKLTQFIPMPFHFQTNFSLEEYVKRTVPLLLQEESFKITDLIPHKKNANVACVVCQKTTKCLLCKECRCKRYCSKECQKKDWPSHKRLCKM